MKNIFNFNFNLFLDKVNPGRGGYLLSNKYLKENLREKIIFNYIYKYKIDNKLYGTSSYKLYSQIVNNSTENGNGNGNGNGIGIENGNGNGIGIGNNNNNNSLINKKNKNKNKFFDVKDKNVKITGNKLNKAVNNKIKLINVQKKKVLASVTGGIYSVVIFYFKYTFFYHLYDEQIISE